MSAAATAHPPLRSHARGMAIGAISALAGIGFAVLLDHDDAMVFDAILLAAIGWIYIGFAVADGRTSSIAVQIGSGLVFFLVAYYGYQWDSTLMLGIGFLAHGAWDWMHHNDRGPTHVRTWYPPFCAVADVVLAVPLLAGWV